MGSRVQAIWAIWQAGELYICGRSKELIIIRGANYYPQDIGLAACDLPGIKRGNVAAS